MHGYYYVSYQLYKFPTKHKTIEAFSNFFIYLAKTCSLNQVLLVLMLLQCPFTCLTLLICLIGPVFPLIFSRRAPHPTPTHPFSPTNPQPSSSSLPPPTFCDASRVASIFQFGSILLLLLSDFSSNPFFLRVPLFAKRNKRKTLYSAISSHSGALTTTTRALSTRV